MTDRLPEKRRDAGEWQPAFLAMLRNSANVRLSCASAGISRKTAYAHRQADPEFREQWDEALEDACDLLEASARMRAMLGDTTLTIFLLKAHRSEVYGDKVKQDITVTIRRQAERMAQEWGLDPDELLREAERIVNGERTQ